MSTFLSGCTQNLGPGYEFSLFKNTPVAKLARAVEDQDTLEILQILNDEAVDPNYQESKFGRTLLHLAVGNGKIISSKLLLENGANPNLKSINNETAVHEACFFPNLKRNAAEILGLLLLHGGDVNQASYTLKDGDTTSYFVPLMGAQENLACTKLLLDHGANPYVKRGKTFLTWRFSNNDVNDQGIFVAYHLIVERKLKIPNPITYTIQGEKPLDIFYYLNSMELGSDTKKERTRKLILDYLLSIKFPNNGAL